MGRGGEARGARADLKKVDRGRNMQNQNEMSERVSGE